MHIKINKNVNKNSVFNKILKKVTYIIELLFTKFSKMYFYETIPFSKQLSTYGRRFQRAFKHLILFKYLYRYLFYSVHYHVL